MPWDMQKATAINRRRNATLLMSKRVQRWMTKDRRSRGSLNKVHVFRLDWIKIGSLESTIFRIGSLAEDKKYNEATKVWLSLILHKIHVDIQIISLEHPRLLSILPAG